MSKSIYFNDEEIRILKMCIWNESQKNVNEYSFENEEAEIKYNKAIESLDKKLSIGIYANV